MSLMDLLEGGAGYYLSEEGIKNAREVGKRGFDENMALAAEVADMTKFQPFTVMTGTGTTTTTPEGGFTLDLSPEQQAMASRLFGQAGQMFDVAGTDPTQASADIYENIRALQRPEEERARLALEERMLSQGRMGMSSAAFGGATPELLAQEQAIANARLSAGLGARKQALNEQAQAFDLGSGLLKQSYLPETMGIDALTAGTQLAQIPDIGRRTGAQLYGQTGQSAVEALLQGEDLAGRLQQQQMQALAKTLFGGGGSGGSGSDDGGLLGDFTDYLGFGEENETPDWLKNLGDKTLDFFGFGDDDEESDEDIIRNALTNALDKKKEES